IIPAWIGPTLCDGSSSAAAKNDKYARHLGSSAGIAIFVSERSDPDPWVRVGRACQRVAPRLTAPGLKYAFVNQPVEGDGGYCPAKHAGRSPSTAHRSMKIPDFQWLNPGTPLARRLSGSKSGAFPMSLFGAMNSAISGLTAQSNAFGDISDN